MIIKTHQHLFSTAPCAVFDKMMYAAISTVTDYIKAYVFKRFAFGFKKFLMAH